MNQLILAVMVFSIFCFGQPALGNESLNRKNIPDPEALKKLKSLQDSLIKAQAEIDLLTESLGPKPDIADDPNKSIWNSRTPAESRLTEAAASRIKVGGHMRFRNEQQNSTGYGQPVTSAAKENLNLFRLRADIEYKVNEKVTFGVSPQAVKTLGGDGFIDVAVGDSVTENQQIESSGFIRNPGLDFYQAFTNYQFTESVSVKLGRQELAYGEHLIIGSLPWDINARSFDALKINYQTRERSTDLFVSKISDDGTDNDATDDSVFYGLYSQLGEVLWLTELDLYGLIKNDQGVSDEINTFGLRLVGQHGSAWYRLESGVQAGLIGGDRIEDGYQIDSDFGYKSKSLDFTFGFTQAGIDYQQLYPTAHKFLGFADIFGRRNIRSYRAQMNYRTRIGLSAHFFYHTFERVNTSEVPYNLTARDFTNNGDSYAEDLGAEIDLVLKYKFLGASQIHLGAALFSPGQYFEDQPEIDSDQSRQFYFLQILTKF